MHIHQTVINHQAGVVTGGVIARPCYPVAPGTMQLATLAANVIKTHLFDLPNLSYAFKNNYGHTE